MRGGGLALKVLQWILRLIEAGCATVVLGIYSYFLAVLHNHDLTIATYIRAVEGISGAALFYTLIGLVLLWCLAGLAFMSSIAILLDIAFAGAFIYVAWATRGGADSCTGNVNTPFGSGNTKTGNSVSNGSGGNTILPTLSFACRLNTACFAVSIIAIFFFLFSALVEVALIRHHKKEKAFGPSPNNGYTAGSPRRKFWQRKPKDEYSMAGAIKPDALPSHATPADVRTSYTTDTTAVDNDPTYSKYGHTAAPIHSGVANGGYTAPRTDGYTRTHQPYNSNPTGTF